MHILFADLCFIWKLKAFHPELATHTAYTYLDTSLLAKENIKPFLGWRQEESLSIFSALLPTGIPSFWISWIVKTKTKEEEEQQQSLYLLGIGYFRFTTYVPCMLPREKDNNIDFLKIRLSLPEENNFFLCIICICLGFCSATLHAFYFVFSGRTKWIFCINLTILPSLGS